MLAYFYQVFLPIVVSFWAFFVAKTGHVLPAIVSPKARRTRRALTAERKSLTEAERAEADLQAVGFYSKELAVPDNVKGVPVYELWGHPAPPMPLLAASLPSAPIGYGWEITTPSVSGDPCLKLSLLELSTTTEVESIEANLIIARRWKYAADETYESFYRRAKAISEKEVTGYRHSSRMNSWSDSEPIYNEDHDKMLGKVMMANLITPMVDWARMLVLRYIAEHPDETMSGYMLIESTRGTVDA